MKNDKFTYPLVLLQSSLIWSAIPVLWSYFPAYFQEIGYSVSQIGIFIAINPIVSILFQPILGLQADRARSKNMVFAILMTGSIIMIFILSKVSNIHMIYLCLVLMSFFQVSLTPLSESLTLECIHNLNKSYAPARLLGSIAYSISAVVIGYFLEIDMNYVFYCVIGISIVHIIVITRMPTIRGHQVRGNRLSIRPLLEDRLLVIFYLFSIIGSLLMSFFYTFFPLHFLNVGGSGERLGVIFLLSALCEVPFLLFADKILKHISSKLLLLTAMFVTGFRVFVLIFVTTPALIYPVSILNGMSFIVFNYIIAVYISKTVSKELRTTGQTVLAFSMGIGRIIGTLFGGYLIEGIGYNMTYLLSFIISLCAIAGFVILAKFYAKIKILEV